MGKSAGKWIKTVLFRKKLSKYSLSKNVTPDKKTTAKAPAEDLSRNPPVISDPYQSTLSHANHEVDSQKINGSVPVKRLDQAASKAQAAFRGYLARRAFRALKGIIRLQALIRGHLVRRQAVATLRCVRAIVKIQALARGHKAGIGAKSLFGSELLATSAFVRQLLVKMPTALPLSLQYEVSEPNSAWSWLERWSVPCFWARTKKITKAKPQRKQAGLQIPEPEPGKVKRTIRKAPTAPNRENGSSPFETDRPKRNPVKLTSVQKEVSHEQSQSELERVKRNLRKVSSVQAPEKSEIEKEKPQSPPPPLESVEIVEKSSPPDVPVLELAISPPKDEDNPYNAINHPEIFEIPLKNEAVDAINDNHPDIESQSAENEVKIEGALKLEDELKEESGKENQKIRKRRSLPPAKQELGENISQNLPSYMASTESAKARLRGQGSSLSKLVEDRGEYGNARRHSLPATTNGRLSSLSPTVQKHVQANGKTNMALTSSRDDKVVHLGWRR